MKIFAIENKDTKITVTFFNKVFTINKIDEIYRTVLLNWNHYTEFDELLPILKLLYSNSKYWRPVYKEMWLIYVTCLLKKGDEKSALKVLRCYVKKFGFVNIESYLPVASFAYKNDLTSDKIKYSAELFELLESNTKSEEWLKYLKGKSIAIVGNGSSLNGSGKGKEIDSHDVVIRFNKFKTKGFENDCGTKTNIWVTNTFLKEDISADDFNFIVFNPSFSYWNHKIDIQTFKKIIKNNRNIHVLPYEVEEYARDCLEDDFYQPTTGASLILMLYKYFKGLDNINFYGFAFLNESFIPLDHYYVKVSKRHSQKAQLMHSFEEESRFLKKLIQNKTFRN